MRWSVGPDDQSLTNPIDRMLAQGDALGAVVKAWAVAVPLGLVGRGIIKVHTHTHVCSSYIHTYMCARTNPPASFHTQGDVPPTPFIAVSMVMTLLFLGAWRSLYVKLAGGEVEVQGAQGKRNGVLDIFRMVTTLIGRW